MASIHRPSRNPRGPFIAVYRLADGRRAWKSTGTTDRRQAEIMCEAWQSAEDALLYGSATKQRITEILNETLKRAGAEEIRHTSVSQWLADWLANCEGSTKPATFTAYQQVVREFTHFLGRRAGGPISAVTQTDINRFKDGLLDDGRAPATVNKLIKKYLNTPFELARKSGQIAVNPINLFRPLQGTSGRKGRFSPDQVVRLLKACNGADSDWYGAILFGYGSGARLQDVANLQWANVDLAAGLIQFDQRKLAGRQSDRPTVLAIHPDFEVWLMKRAGDSSGPVFPTLAGRDDRTGALSKSFSRIMVRANIKPAVIKERSAKGNSRSVKALSFHSFRHAAASSVFNAEAIKEVSRRVTGHSRNGELDRYLEVDAAALKAAVSLIPRLPVQ
jgi:integrase